MATLEVKAVRMRFLSPISVTSLQHPCVLPADLLFSAIMHSLVSVGESWEDIRERLVLTSAFPMRDGEPLFVPPLFPRLDEDRLLTAEDMSNALCGGSPGGVPWQEVVTVVSQTLFSPRLGEKHTLFEARVKDMWFGYSLPEELEGRLLKALRWLGMEGVGGRRDEGFGRFEVDRFSFEMDVPDNPNVWVTLSPVAVDDGSLSRVKFFRMRTARGWLQGSTFARKKSVLLFSEGSVFSDRVEGKLVEDTPEGSGIKTFRYGKAFVVGGVSGES